MTVLVTIRTSGGVVFNSGRNEFKITRCFNLENLFFNLKEQQGKRRAKSTKLRRYLFPDKHDFE